MKKHFLIPVLFFLASCSGVQPASKAGASESTENTAAKKTDTGSKEETKSKDDDQNNRPVGDKINYRLLLSFYSKGEGPDSKALDIAQTYISDYETQNHLKISIDKIPWGREGEVDYGFTLDNLGQEAQNNFIIQLRELLIQSQLVHIAENTTSVHSH